MGIISLPEDLDIARVAELYADLRRALEAREEVTMEAAAVRRMDTAGAQLILAFMRDAREQWVRVRLVEPSVSFNSALVGLGLIEAISEASGSSWTCLSAGD